MQELLFITAGIAGGAGLLLVVLGLAMWARTRRFIQRSVAVEGVVTGAEERRGARGTYYRNVVQFRLPDGRVIAFVDSIGANPPRFRVGEVVLVRYDSFDPTNARIASGSGMWLLPGLVVALGVLPLVVGIVLLIAAVALPLPSATPAR